MLRALWQHVRGRHGSGASTLAMQVARMQHPRPRTLWAKAVEAGTAIVLTARYGHAAVLAQYLRLAPYGENSHGIAHAARWYFDKPAADLDAAQAALLCAIPQAPGHLALHRNHARAAIRARQALAAMALPPAERATAEAELATLVPVAAPRRPATLQLALRLQRLVHAGGMVRATLDAPTQRWVTATAVAHLHAWRRDGAQQVAVMVVRRGSREVLADVASAGFDSQPAGSIDYSATLRSPGSTLKPFLYALGLDRRLIAPQDVLADLPEGAAGISNADHDFLGPLLPRQALANSRNVPATNLLRRIGLADGFGFLRTLGLHQLDSPAQRYGLAMAIGALPTSLDRLMRAYAALAEDGMDGNLRWFVGPSEETHRVISVDAARLVGRFLSDPLARLPSFPRYGSSEFPFAVALKTGTSQGYRDAWTVEWSRDYLVGVWVGRADAGPMTQLSGGRAAAELAQSIMLRLHGRRAQRPVSRGVRRPTRAGAGGTLHRHRRAGRPGLRPAAGRVGPPRRHPRGAAAHAAPVHRAAGPGHACLAQPGGAGLAQPPGPACDRRAPGAADRLAGGRPAGGDDRAGHAAALDHDAGASPLPGAPAAGGRRLASGRGGGGIAAAARSALCSAPCRRVRSGLFAPSRRHHRWIVGAGSLHGGAVRAQGLACRADRARRRRTGSHGSRRAGERDAPRPPPWPT